MTNSERRGSEGRNKDKFKRFDSGYCQFLTFRANGTPGTGF